MRFCTRRNHFAFFIGGWFVTVFLTVVYAEDRGVIGADSLWKELDSWKNRGLPTLFMKKLKSLFRDFDEVYK